VFDIPHLSAEKRDALIEQGILALEDLPDDAELGPQGERFLRLYRAGTKEIDLEGIRAWLDHLAFPIHFLDLRQMLPRFPDSKGLAHSEASPSSSRSTFFTKTAASRRPRAFCMKA